MFQSFEHPLFKRPPTTQISGQEQKGILRRVPVGELLVRDYMVGLIPIHQSCHYALAKDLAQGDSGDSAKQFYRLYRQMQFRFSETQLDQDVSFFIRKIESPIFDIPIKVFKRRRVLIVLDGFHRLAIAAAYDKATVPVEILTRNGIRI